MPSTTATSLAAVTAPLPHDSLSHLDLPHLHSPSLSPSSAASKHPSGPSLRPPSPTSALSLTSSPTFSPPFSSLPPLSISALRRLRGFSTVDRLYHSGHVLLLKRSSSPLSLSVWKLRTAVLAFGSLTFFRVATSPPAPSLPSFLCASTPTVAERLRVSLNYACLDLVGYDPSSSLYILRLLSDVSSTPSHLSLTRQWFTLAFPSKEECRQWVAALTPAIAHPLSIHYQGDNVSVRLREPIEPPTPSTQSTLHLRPRGYKGEVRLIPKYPSSSTELEGDTDEPSLVERKQGEYCGETEEDPPTPVALTALFTSLPFPLSVDLRPSPLFALYDLPPASFLSPLIDRLYHNKIGFGCLTHSDRVLEQTTHSSLLFGEVLFPGVTKLMDGLHLDGRVRGEGRGGGLSVVDLGSGVGKLCMQVFLQYDSVERVEGVELAFSRYGLGQQAMLELVREGGEGGDQPGGPPPRGANPYHLLHSSPTSTTIASALPSTFPYPRTLTLSRGNLFQCQGALMADVVIIETLITVDCYALLSRMLEGMRVGMRLLTFGDIRGLWGEGVDAENLRVRRQAREKRGEVGVAGGDGRGVGARVGGEREEGEGEGEDEEEDEEGEEVLAPLRYTECPFVQLEANQSKLDRFLTTWSSKKGHYFYLWRKVM